MADQFVAEIRIFPFNFAPTGWAFCSGQLLPISQNTALFSLLGTTYGGDGRSTFALPNLNGQAAMAAGQGPGLSERFLGESSGVPNVTLLPTEMPTHTHLLQAFTISAGNLLGPEADGTSVLARSSNGDVYNATATPVAPMAFQAVTTNGNGFPHNNMQPYLTLNFCIALQGIFPARP